MSNTGAAQSERARLPGRRTPCPKSRNPTFWRGKGPLLAIVNFINLFAFGEVEGGYFRPSGKCVLGLTFV